MPDNNETPLSPAAIARKIARLRRPRSEEDGGLPTEVWRNWRFDLLTAILSGIYQGSVWVFALQLARGNLHASAWEMGIATAAPAFGYLFVLIWAQQMEGRAKLPFVTVTWLLTRGLYVLTPLLVHGLHATEIFITMLCITPIVFSVSTPAYTAIMQEIYPVSYRGRLMSYVRIGGAASGLVTARLMGWLQQHEGLDYRWMFFIGGLFGIGTALSFGCLRLPPTRPGTPPRLRHFVQRGLHIFKENAGYRRFCLGVFIGGCGNLTASTYYPIYQVDRLHITPIEISSIAVGASLASLASLFFWGWFLDRHGPIATTFLAVGINSITPFLYALQPGAAFLILAGACNGFALSGVDIGYLNTNIRFAEPGEASLYQAIHSTLFGIRGTLAPLLAIPLIHALGYRWPVAFILCGTALFTGAVIQSTARLPHKEEDQ